MRYTPKQLEKFRSISKCDTCAHYIGCPFWMSVLLLNHERTGEFFKLMLPDIEEKCLMYIKHPMLWGRDHEQGVAELQAARKARKGAQ